MCDSGYVRTGVTEFVCICENHGDQCTTIQNACEAGTTTASPNDDPDDSSDNNEDLELSSKSSGIPDWALALIIVGDIIACVLLSLGIWACWDYHDKKKAEQYWNLYMNIVQRMMSHHLPLQLRFKTLRFETMRFRTKY